MVTNNSKLDVRVHSRSVISRRIVFTFLVALTAWNVLMFWGREQSQGLGNDVAQWYTAGLIINQNQSDILYEQDAFRKLSKRTTGLDYYSLYPPQTAVLFSLISRLPYSVAVWILLILQLVAITYAACALIGGNKRNSASFIPILLFSGFLPFSYSLQLCQLSGFLLAILTITYRQLQKNRALVAGLLISLFAVKPTLFVGVCIWVCMRFRRSPKLLIGLIVGSILQAGIIVVIEGVNPIFDYIRLLPVLSDILHEYTFTVNFQHGFKGIITNLFPTYSDQNLTFWHAVFCAIALAFFARAVWKLRFENFSTEFSLMVIFTLAIAPHILTYDLSLLILPVFLLLNSDRLNGRIFFAIVIYATVVFTFMPLVMTLGFSPIPLVLLSILWAIPSCVIQLESTKNTVKQVK